MDPLSDVLSLLKLRSLMCFGFDAGGDWSLAFEAGEGLKFYAAVAGECWLVVEGVAEPLRIRAGDCLMLPMGRPFRVTNDLALMPVNPLSAAAQVRDGDIVVRNGGGDFFSVCGYFALTGNHAEMLLEVLPPVVHIRSESDKAVLRWCLERMRQELRDAQPGGFLVAQQLATIMLVQALRLHLTDATRGDVGWLFALADRQMSAAITAMHHEPARRWTLQTLAERVGMSRTAFAVKFKETVGLSVMDYLTRWRMMLAGDRLETSGDSISVIARSLGYESESAFSTAFKRIMGCSPRKYGRGQARVS
jgi:AraC-like DNA-binding protein